MSTDMQKVNGNGIDVNPQATTEAAARMAHEMVDRVAKIAGESEEKLRKASLNTSETVKHSLDTARDKWEVARTNINSQSDAMKTSVTGFIKEHPFAALGIAFGTGVLMSYLTRGNRRVEQNDDSA